MGECDNKFFNNYKPKKMSNKTKFYTTLALFLSIGVTAFAQQTVEVPTTSGSFPGGSGPSTAAVGPISLMRDNLNNNNFTAAAGANLTNVTMSLANQQYTGLPYSNISTGLVFGAQPTTASGGVVQGVDAGNVFDNLGSFAVSPGGPPDNMFTAASNFPSGTGIVSGALFGGAEANGAAFVFTAAQPQYNAPGGPTVNNTATRYYYGDLVINFNRYISFPVLHVAGLGGSYRYFPVTGTDINDPTQWLSTYFSTELEIVGFTGLKLSGNSNLVVSGSSITNSSTAPSGASVNTVGGLFNEFGAASGSIKINANVNSIRLRVYLRGSNASQFAWSAIGAPGVGQQVSGGTRNPFPGDIWSVSVSSQISELIPLPAIGVNLTAALNGSDVLLKWKTQTEINTSYFEIERSIDGINFSSLANKTAAGNSVTEVSYNHIDANMNVSVYYYRLKQVDIDNKFVYSNIAVVRKAGSVKGVRTFPNPVTSQVNLEFSNAKGNYVVSVYSQNGQQVIAEKATITNTVQYITIDRKSLSSGSYFVRVKNTENGEVLFSDKIILQ
jgi:Secretion system C-terminal sorting domain